MENVKEYNFKKMQESIDIMIEEADQLYREIAILYQASEAIDGIETIECLADVPGDLRTAIDLISRGTKELIVAYNDIVYGMKELKKQ